MKFHLLNVFTTNEKNSGNQLAVVLHDEILPDPEMQSIAKDFNFSETVFIRENYYLRIFTPKSELPFAGHPTIGAAWQISQLTKKKNFSLEAPRGVLEIEAINDGARLTFPGTAAIKNYSGDLKNVLQHCGVSCDQVHTDLVRLVNVGPEFLVIPLKSHGALKKAKSPITLIEGLKCYFIFQEDPSHFYVRMFSPALSVIEDSATGSAACALAGFANQVMNIPAGNVLVSQGVEMGRPSQINIEWSKDRIQLSGSVVHWGQGNL